MVKLYLVDGSLLTKEIIKVAEINELIDKTSISQACRDFDISRSTFYKYRDSIRIIESEEGD